MSQLKYEMKPLYPLLDKQQIPTPATDSGTHWSNFLKPIHKSSSADTNAETPSPGMTSQMVSGCCFWTSGLGPSDRRMV